jgi:hypothetical protein
MATLNDVARIAGALPGVSEGLMHGLRSWKVNGKGFVWERPLRKNELAALGKAAPKGVILGVRTPDLEMKDVLLASDRKAFFTTPHFDGYAAVLVHLPSITVAKLRPVIVEAWLTRASKSMVDAFLGEHR